MSTSHPSAKPPPPFQPLAAVLAWVFPGAGHLLLGHRRRAALIAAGIGALFASGLFIGGITCVDRRENFFWFLGQALTGPIALVTDYVHQTSFKAYDLNEAAAARSVDELRRLPRRSAWPNEVRVYVDVPDGRGGKVAVPAFRPADPTRSPPEKPAPPAVKGLGRVGELGTLFCTIAGFMNLICIIDAAWRRRFDPAEEAAAEAAAREASREGRASGARTEGSAG